MGIKLLLFGFLLGFFLCICYFLGKFLKAKKEKEKLNQKLKNLEELLYNLPMPVFLSNEKEIKWENKKALEVFGDLRGKNKEILKEKIKGTYWEFYEISSEQRFKMQILFDRSREEIFKKSYQVALAYLSHELKTPFTVMKGYAERIEEKLKNNINKNKLEQDFWHLKSALERIEAFVYKLFTSLEYLVKDLKIKKETFDLKEAIEEVIFWVKPFCEDKNIALEVDIPEGIKIEGDKYWLMQAILNPLENAIKFSLKDEKVLLKVYFKEKEKINILIRDKGPGVSPQELPFLGLPFFKSSAEKGLGFGLFLTKKIIEAHGGKIQFNLPPNGGLEVIMELPGSIF